MLEALGIGADIEGDDIGADEAPEVVLLVPVQALRAKTAATASAAPAVKRVVRDMTFLL